MRTPNLSIPARIIAGVAAIIVVTTGVTLATPGAGVTSTNVSVGRFDDIRLKSRFEDHKVEISAKGASDLYVVSNVIAPGGHTGWHTHPGPSLITVKTGTITAYEGDDPTCTGHVYHQGEGFLDPGDGHVHILRNESGAAAETIAVQLLPAGAVRRIDVENPGYCPF